MMDDDDNDELPPPKVTDAPAAIWLVYGDIERDCTHWECARNGDVGWCEDKQFDSDVEYVRADTIEAQADQIRARDAQWSDIVAAAVAREREKSEHEAKLWREHLHKLDALIAFCPTCAEGKNARADMTRDEVIFECGKTAGRAAAIRAGSASPNPPKPAA
jgi:hypothetical protein